MVLQQYQRLQVQRLLLPAEAYDGWCINQPPPRMGDVGTIVDILQSPGHADRYTVECSAADGITLFLGDFLAEELEPVPE